MAPSFLLVSGGSCGAGMFHSAGLLGAAFVRGAAAAGVQDRHELLQLLEGADTQFVVDVLVVEAQGLSLIHISPERHCCQRCRCQRL